MRFEKDAQGHKIIFFFSRITPGGKAAAANVAVGDYLLAVNHQALQDASLLNVMELIKGQMQNICAFLCAFAKYLQKVAEFRPGLKLRENGLTLCI